MEGGGGGGAHGEPHEEPHGGQIKRHRRSRLGLLLLGEEGSAHTMMLGNVIRLNSSHNGRRT